MGIEDELFRRMFGHNDDEDDEEDGEKYKTETDKVMKRTEEANLKMKGSEGALHPGQICKLYTGTSPNKRLDNMELGKRHGSGVLLTKIKDGKEAELWLVRYWDEKTDKVLPGGMDTTNYALFVTMVHADHIIKDLNDPVNGDKPLFEKIRAEHIGDVPERVIQALCRFIMTSPTINNHAIEWWLEAFRPLYAMKKQMEFLEMMGLKNK